MKQVLLDTNFILTCVKQKIDFEQLITSKSWKLTNLIDDKLGSGAGWVHSYYNTWCFFHPLIH